MNYERSKHYQPILNMVAASGSAGFCIPCNQSYWRAVDHRCSIKCYKCKAMPPCDMTIQLKKCASCFRSFFGELCYENHLNKGSFDKNSSVCDKMKICQICFRTVRVKNSRSHECGVSYCKTCKLHLPTRHLCHIQTIKTKAKESTPNSIFLFYDFETQQTLEVLGDKEKKIHVPNVCIVQQVCTFCLHNDNISVPCAHCGIHEYVLKNESVKQLVELALEPRQHFK